jgi:teichuronic acid biosynthesis glycosyltransferase TuaC
MTAVRALVVTNMWPSRERPALGSFVRDQVQALRARDDLELELYTFEPGALSGYAEAAPALRRRYGNAGLDIVHAHFGLTAWPARLVRAPVHAVTLHGTDVMHPRSRVITLAGLPLQDLVGVVSEELAGRVPRWATRGHAPAVLPCGVATDRFVAGDRAAARAELGLSPEAPYLLFPADPARPEKRFDRVQALLAALPSDAPRPQLLTLGAIEPERVPLYVNAADAVVVTSERESFGLAALEALACDVPVLSTPVGVAPQALAGVPETLCAPFDPTVWAAFVSPLLAQAGTEHRIPGGAGRARALPYGADAMAGRVVEAWAAQLARRG